jgi:hypothetical protein
MSFDDPMNDQQNREELRYAWREATSEWLEARSHYERLQSDTTTDLRKIMEAAQRYEFTSHRRTSLTREAEHLSEMLDAYATLRTTRSSAR